MRLLFILLLLTLSLFSNDKVALVIGNKNYNNQTGLNNPIKDAKLIRNTLQGMGFEVLEAYNKDLDSLGNKLEAFVSKARNAKVAVVYYAGHGIGVGSRNYLIPLGATNLSKSNLARKLLSVEELKEAVANAKGFGVVLFDACRNSFFSGAISGLSSGRASRALVPPTVRRANVLVSFSTQAGTKAEDDVNGGDHSPYAIALSENLKNNRDIRLVMGSIRTRVYGLTAHQQYPIEKNMLDGENYCLSGVCQEQELKVVEKIVYRDRIVEQPRRVETATNSSKWITPTNSACKANGGKIVKGVCQANWKNAKKICSQSGGQLPSREDLKQVVVDCGGIVNSNLFGKDAEKNRKNSSYQSCYKGKGFDSNYYYWSSTSNSNSNELAWVVNFRYGTQDSSYKSHNNYVRCVRAGQ